MRTAVAAETSRTKASDVEKRVPKASRGGEATERGRLGRRSAGFRSPTPIPRDGKQRMTFEWDDAHVNLIGHGRSEVPETADGYRCEMLYRHDTHTQSLMPLNVPAVIAVAPAAYRVHRTRGRRADPGLPSRAPGASGAAPGHVALGPLPDPGGRGTAVQRAGSSLRRGQPLRGPGSEGSLGRGGALVSAAEWRRRRVRTVELDDAEEAEVFSATVDDLVEAVTARASGPDGEGRPTFTTTSPNWWMGDRTFGGMVVAQALHAAMQTAPAGPEVHSLHGYFLRPTAPGLRRRTCRQRARRALVQHLRDVRSLVDGKETFRMACSFHAPEDGDEYQLPMAPGVPPPQEIEGFEAPFPFDIRELGATERREDGTYRVDAPMLVPHAGTVAGRPSDPCLRVDVLLRHDRGLVPPVEPRRRGGPTPTPASTMPSGSTGHGGPMRGVSSTSMRS